MAGASDKHCIWEYTFPAALCGGSITKLRIDVWLLGFTSWEIDVIALDDVNNVAMVWTYFSATGQPPDCTTFADVPAFTSSGVLCHALGSFSYAYVTAL
jgi:hypothetical protein